MGVLWFFVLATEGKEGGDSRMIEGERVVRIEELMLAVRVSCFVKHWN